MLKPHFPKGTHVKQKLPFEYLTALKIDLESGAEWSILEAVWKPWLSLREKSGDFSRDPLYARCQAHQKLWHSSPSNQWISECWASLLSSSLSILRFDAEIHEPFVLEELSEDFASKKKTHRSDIAWQRQGSRNTAISPHQNQRCKELPAGLGAWHAEKKWAENCISCVVWVCYCWYTKPCTSWCCIYIIYHI